MNESEASSARNGPITRICMLHLPLERLPAAFLLQEQIEHGHVIPSITANCIALAIAGRKAGRAGQEAKTRGERKVAVQAITSNPVRSP